MDFDSDFDIFHGQKACFFVFFLSHLMEMSRPEKIACPAGVQKECEPRQKFPARPVLGLAARNNPRH